MSERPSPIPENYDDFLRDLKERIRSAQVRAALSVNRELVLLYWQLGRDILTRQRQQGWGAKVLDRLASDLQKEFPDMKGFSPRNLKYMRAFAEAYPNEQIVQEVLAQITWYHNISAVDDLLRHPDDQPTIGIILCRGKKKTVAEYALRDLNKPIGISTYKLKDSLPQTLQGNLPTLEQLEIELNTVASEIEAEITRPQEQE